MSKDIKSVVQLFLWVHVNPDNSADGQDTLWAWAQALQTILPLRVHRVTDSWEGRDTYSSRALSSCLCRSNAATLYVPCSGGFLACFERNIAAADFCYISRKPFHHTKLNLTGI